MASEGGPDIDLYGDLAGILALASDTKAKTAVADVAEAVSQISLVAGVRHYRKRTVVRIKA